MHEQNPLFRGRRRIRQCEAEICQLEQNVLWLLPQAENSVSLKRMKKNRYIDLLLFKNFLFT